MPALQALEQSASGAGKRVLGSLYGNEKMPRTKHYNLLSRLSGVGLQQYHRKLQAMGFDDVEQVCSRRATAMKPPRRRYA